MKIFKMMRSIEWHCWLTIGFDLGSIGIWCPIYMSLASLLFILFSAAMVWSLWCFLWRRMARTVFLNITLKRNTKQFFSIRKNTPSKKQPVKNYLEKIPYGASRWFGRISWHHKDNGTQANHLKDCPHIETVSNDHCI